MAKKPTAKERDKVLRRYVSDYEQAVHALHKQFLWNAASALGMAPEELEEDWATLT